MPREFMPRGALILALALVVSCSSAGHRTEPAPAATDTIIGLVQAGNDSTAPIDLLPSSTRGDAFGQPIKLVATPSLRSVNGLVVQVVGMQARDKRWPDKVTVLRFTVMSAKGEPATDGKLADDAGALYLVTADGRWHPLAHPPASFHAHVGARVWIAGPLDREPVTYGIIE